jgi:hypothetical protein
VHHRPRPDELSQHGVAATCALPDDWVNIESPNVVAIEDSLQKTTLLFLTIRKKVCLRHRKSAPSGGVSDAPSAALLGRILVRWPSAAAANALGAQSRNGPSEFHNFRTGTNSIEGLSVRERLAKASPAVDSTCIGSTASGHTREFRLIKRHGHE